MSGYVKTKILKYDAKQVNHIHKVGDTQNAHEMMQDGQKFTTQDVDALGDNNLTLKKVERPIDVLIDYQEALHGPAN